MAHAIALVLPAEGSANVGNAMICEAVERILRRPPFSGHVERFTCLRRPTAEELERINRCDRAIFVGTNIFQPHTAGWEWRTEDLEKIEVPYSLYGVGYSGPLHGAEEWEVADEVKELLKWAGGAEWIAVRDPQTQTWLEHFGLRSELVGCPVIAYAEDFSGITLGSGRPILVVRQILLHSPGGEAVAAQRAMIDWFFKEYSDGICVVQEPADLGLLEGRPIVTDFSDIVRVLSQAQFVFSARLHAGMLALSFGRPAVFLAHDTRVASFCEMVGLPSRQLSFEGLKEAIHAVKAIERGDLAEFKPAVVRIPLFRERLERFLARVLAETMAERISLHERRTRKLVVQLQSDFHELTQQLVWLREQLQARDKELAELRQKLTEIYSSTAWQLLEKYWRWVNRLLPLGTRRRLWYSRMLRAVKIILSDGWRGLGRRLKARVHPRTAPSLSEEPPSLPLEEELDEIPSISKKGDKIRLLILIPTMDAGGTERCAEVLLENFDRKKFELELVQLSDREPFYKIPSDVTVHVLERYRQPQINGNLAQLFPEMLSQYADELTWLDATAYKLALLIRKRQPDVILAQDFYASTIVLIAKQHLPPEVKIIGSLHSQYSHFLQTVQHGDLYAVMIRRYFNKADRIIAISQGIAQDLIENFGVRQNIVTVIHNPLDLAQAKNLAQEPISEHRWFSEEIQFFLFVGRLSSQKGLEYLLRAIALARRSEKFRCAIIGDGEKRQELEALAQQLKLTEDVVFLGRQSNPFKFMHRATCFVLPSIVEGVPYVILEAMACGCPIIATDCTPGVRELLGNGGRGLLVPPRNPQALAAALLKMLWRSDLREAFSSAGLQHAQESSAEKIVKQYESLLRQYARSSR